MINPITLIDDLLNRITMYRLVVYELLVLLAAALVLSLFGVLPYNPLYLIFSTAFLFVVSWVVNKIFAFGFDTPSNHESVWITALILALIIAPPSTWFDTAYLPLAFWAASFAMASKYILAIRKKHILNPAALGVAVTSLVLGLSATWWVATPAMAYVALPGGLLIVRKLRRFDLFLAFNIVFALGIAFTAYTNGISLNNRAFLMQSFLFAPVIFFSTVMLTEPLTTPPTRWLRILYGAFVAIMFLPDFNVASFYFTPELALLAGNIFSYLFSPKYKLALTLKRILQLSPDVFEFEFSPNRPVWFEPGQYMEWTCEHRKCDNRGIRRYFTLASSPTEDTVKLGVKFYEPASSFKKVLLSMKEGEAVMAGGLSGDFTLPKNGNQKLVFIAGGIGVTPFRSMIQYLLDNNEKRPITMLYANKTPNDAVYRELFDRARDLLGMKTVYAFDDKNVSPAPDVVSKIDPKTIRESVPDFAERLFYISGPQGMVRAFKSMLIGMGVSRRRIKTDYFPGFA